MSNAKLTRPERDLLERAFSAEIEGSLADLPPVMQTRSKLADKLVEDGLLLKVEATLGGRFPVTINGFMLTEAGRIAYCYACDPDRHLTPPADAPPKAASGGSRTPATSAGTVPSPARGP